MYARSQSLVIKILVYYHIIEKHFGETAITTVISGNSDGTFQDVCIEDFLYIFWVVWQILLRGLPSKFYQKWFNLNKFIKWLKEYYL